MSVRFQCPECGKSLKAREEDAGRQTACSRCGTRLTIPAATAAAQIASAVDGADAASTATVFSPDEDEPLLSLPIAKRSEDLIDMTAMVDIVFFLLIFFLVTTLQAVLAVINLPTPQAAGGTASANRSLAEYEQDPDYVMVKIEEDDSIWVEEEQVFNDQELRVRLRSAGDKLGRPPSVLVVGNADATNISAVRVFDACAYAKVKNVSFLVQEGGTEQ